MKNEEDVNLFALPKYSESVTNIDKGQVKSLQTDVKFYPREFINFQT